MPFSLPDAIDPKYRNKLSLPEKAYDNELFETLNNKYNVTPEVFKEMEQIKKDAIEWWYFLQAPNWKPSNLNEKLWLLVRTKNFKKWFWDWEKNVSTVTLKEKKHIGTGRSHFYEYTINDSDGYVSIIVDTKNKTINISGIEAIKGKWLGVNSYIAIQNKFPEYTILSDKNALSWDAIKMWDRMVINNIAIKRGEKDYYLKLPDASKIVDENGEPKIMYHWSNKRNISEFRIDTQKRKWTKDWVYFTSHRKKAKEYTMNWTIYEDFLNIKNPLIIDFEWKFWSNFSFQDAQLLLNKTEQELKDIQKPYYKTSTIEDIINTFKSFVWRIKFDDSKWNYAIDQIVKIARRLWYDWIIAKNVKDIWKFSSLSRKSFTWSSYRIRSKSNKRRK